MTLQWYYAVFFLLCVNFLLWVQPKLLGNLEGYLFPVLSDIELIDHKYDPPPEGLRHVWTGKAHRNRNCNFVDIEWYLGPRTGPKVQVISFFEDMPKLRNIGVHHWDALVIYLTPDDVVKNSHATIIHDCGWPWLTRTPFHDSPR